MNTSLRRISVTVMALIVLLLANATLTQVFTADGLRADPRNQRVLLDEYSRQRGQISAGGQLLAYSVSTNGRFRFLRVYPESLHLRPGHRVLLAAVLQHRPRARRGHHPQRLRPTAVRPAARRLLHRPRPARRQRRRPRSTRRCSRRPGMRWQGGCNGPCKGAVVALEPSTGKILAMVSAPSLRPQPAGQPRRRRAVRRLAAARDDPGNRRCSTGRSRRPTRPGRRSRSSPRPPRCRPGPPRTTS